MTFSLHSTSIYLVPLKRGRSIMSNSIEGLGSTESRFRKLISCSDSLPLNSHHPDRRIIVLTLLSLGIFLRRLEIDKNIIPIDNIRIINRENLLLSTDAKEDLDLLKTLGKGGIWLNNSYLFVDRPTSHVHFGTIVFLEVWKSFSVNDFNERIRDMLKSRGNLNFSANLSEAIAMIRLKDFHKTIAIPNLGFPEDPFVHGPTSWEKDYNKDIAKEALTFFNKISEACKKKLTAEDICLMFSRAQITGDYDEVATLLPLFN